MRRRHRRYDDYYGWAPYVPVAERRRAAEREAAARRKKGERLEPVTVAGRSIATTFWGKAWCQNLERYGDYANRLPRGRTYVRNGSVIDLRLEKGKVLAQVMGSSLYRVEVSVTPLKADRWEALVRECAGKVASVLELLQGKLSGAVMDVITRQGTGLFPEPAEIRFTCSCPDWASMCKHVAATLYGVGSRLDHGPELLFLLRGVDHAEMVGRAEVAAILQGTAPAAEKHLDGGDLAGLFGIELEDRPAPRAVKPAVAGDRKAPRTGKGESPVPPPQAQGGKRQASATGTERKKTPLAPGPVLPAGRKIVKTKVRRRPQRTGLGEGVPGSARPAKPSRSQPKTVAAKDLTGRGIPHPVIQQWLTQGILLRTSRRGVYETTSRLDLAVAGYLEKNRTD